MEAVVSAMAERRRQLEAGELDIGILTPQLAPPGLRSRKLMSNGYKLIVRRNHPIVRGACTLDQFVALEHVICEPRAATFSGATDDALAALGKQRKVVLSVASFLIVAEIVARSDLIAIVPEGVVRDRADRLQILPPPLEVARFDLLILWHERTQAHAGHKWVRDELGRAVPG